MSFSEHSIVAAAAAPINKKEVKSTQYISKPFSNSLYQRSSAQPSSKPVSAEDYHDKSILSARYGGGETWTDHSLLEWDPNDFRIFCGDLGPEVTDEVLKEAFKKYKSIQKVKVVRDNRTGVSKGYGFVSFKNGKEYLLVLKEMNGKFIGNRPVKLKKSLWKDRQHAQSSSNCANPTTITNSTVQIKKRKLNE